MVAEHGNALLGFLGGEHSITPAIIEGVRRKTAGEDFGIIWIDAHADLRKSFHGRPDNHACAGFNSARFGNIVQIGIRSLAEEEASYLKRSDSVQAFREWGEEVRDAIRALPWKVYLSIDLDGLSPTLMRAVGTPEPGGLLWDEIMDILDFAFAVKDVRAFDVVELCPAEGDVVSTYTAARLVYKVMSYHARYNLEKK
jgi:agmatinase